MKNNILKYSECANCGACYNRCPTGAITVADNLFYTLSVDCSKCINCGICTTVCPVNNPIEKQNLLYAFGGFNIDENVVKNSSSGGAFYAIANYVLSKNGIVFGAAYDDNCRKVIIKNTDEIRLEELLRSKYVESLVGDSFKIVEKHLKSGRLVLFCGCPCQVAGLVRYLGKEYYNLITCDFSCGGLPSHEMYLNHIDAIEKKYKSSVKSVNFRPKIYGWEAYTILIELKNKKKYKKLFFMDPFFAGFIGKHYIVRDNCLTCRFSDNHYADIVLADFWKYKSLSTLHAGDGLSLVLINSQKGIDVWNEIKSEMNLQELDLSESSYNIKKNQYSQAFLNNRSEFIEFYKNNGLEAAAEKYVFDSAINNFRKQTKIYLKNLIRKIKI